MDLAHTLGITEENLSLQADDVHLVIIADWLTLQAPPICWLCIKVCMVRVDFAGGSFLPGQQISD